VSVGAVERAGRVTAPRSHEVVGFGGEDARRLPLLGCSGEALRGEAWVSPTGSGQSLLEVDDAAFFDEELESLLVELSDVEVDSDFDEVESELSLDPDEPEDDEPERLSFL